MEDTILAVSMFHRSSARIWPLLESLDIDYTLQYKHNGDTVPVQYKRLRIAKLEVLFYSGAQQWISGGPQPFYGPQIQHFQPGKLPFKDKTLSTLSPF